MAERRDAWNHSVQRPTFELITSANKDALVASRSLLTHSGTSCSSHYAYGSSTLGSAKHTMMKKEHLRREKVSDEMATQKEIDSTPLDSKQEKIIPAFIDIGRNDFGKIGSSEIKEDGAHLPASEDSPTACIMCDDDDFFNIKDAAITCSGVDAPISMEEEPVDWSTFYHHDVYQFWKAQEGHLAFNLDDKLARILDSDDRAEVVQNNLPANLGIIFDSDESTSTGEDSTRISRGLMEPSSSQLDDYDFNSSEGSANAEDMNQHPDEFSNVREDGLSLQLQNADDSNGISNSGYDGKEIHSSEESAITNKMNRDYDELAAILEDELRVDCESFDDSTDSYEDILGKYKTFWVPHRDSKGIDSAEENDTIEDMREDFPTQRDEGNDSRLVQETSVSEVTSVSSSSNHSLPGHRITKTTADEKVQHHIMEATKRHKSTFKKIKGASRPRQRPLTSPHYRLYNLSKPKQEQGKKRREDIALAIKQKHELRKPEDFGIIPLSKADNMYRKGLWMARSRESKLHEIRQREKEEIIARHKFRLAPGSFASLIYPNE